MSIIKKIKTTIKHEISQLISVMPIADLRSILAPRGVLIFENERESHLHTLSLLHGAMRRDFFADDVTRWREDFGHRGEAIRYLSNTNSSRSWSFDVYSAASVTLLRDLYVPGEEPPPVQLPELDDAVQAWNAQHGTEFYLIDESELSELRAQAAAWNRRELKMVAGMREKHLDEVGVVLDHCKSESSVLRQRIAELESDIVPRLIQETEDLKQTIQEMESDIESITNDATEADGEIRDLKQTIQELEDRAQELQGELDEWHSLGSGYGLNLDVDDVGERLDTLTEWEPVIDLGWSPSEIEEKLEDANDWFDLGDDTGMTPCEISQELDRLQEVDADLEEVKNQLSRAKSKALEIGMVWRSLEISLDI